MRKEIFLKMGSYKKLDEMFGNEKKVNIIYVENNHGESVVYLVSDTNLRSVQCAKIS